MKKSSLFGILAMAAVATSAVSAADFADPVRVEAGGKAVRTESPGYAAPCWVDFDGDGKKDLLVGQFAGGKINVFKNLGDGKLAAGDWLQVQGKAAIIPGVWWCTSSTPQFVDLNNDGHLDVLSGSYSARNSRPMAGRFQVLWGDADGGFSEATELNSSDGKPLEIVAGEKASITTRICTRPTAVDWDSDGDLDLIVGNFAGTFFLFEGEAKGKFKAKAKPLKTGDDLLKVNQHSDPVVIDWDSDGDLDLLSGAASGGVYLATNTAGKGETPVLKPFQTLIEPGPSRKYGTLLRETDLKGPGRSTRIWVDDINDDGKLDLLVGDRTHLLFPANGMTGKQFKKKKAAWDKESKAIRSLLVDTKEKEQRKVISKKLRDHYTSRKDFEMSESTGFVWLYLQK